MARPEPAPRHAKKSTNHRNAALRFLRVLHVFQVTRIAAAAFMFVGRIDVILHRILLLHVARVAAAGAAATVLGRRNVILPYVLLHFARVATTCTATCLVRRHDVILHRVLLRPVTRVTAAATRVHHGSALRDALCEGDAGDYHRQTQHADYLSKRIHDYFSYRKEMIASHQRTH
jgi:hypothetical protein